MLGQLQQGVTLRDHLLQVEKQTGEAPEELEGPPFPGIVAHWWGWFNELGATRSCGADGPACISYSEIQSWANLTGRTPTPFEVRMLRRLDMLYLTSRAENQEG